MSEQNDSFRNKSLKDKTFIVVTVTLLIIVGVGFVFGLYFFGLAGVFKLLGVQYVSNWSLVIFVFCFFILGLFVELFSRAIFELTVEYKNITGKVKLFLNRFCFEGVTNWLVLFTVDEFMKGITLTIQSEIIIAIVVAILEIVFDEKRVNRADS